MLDPSPLIDIHPLPLRLRIFVISLSCGLLLFIVELIRRRLLREEYALFWLMTGVGISILALRLDLLAWVTVQLGVDSTNSTLFFFGIFFIMLVALHHSTRISRLSEQFKDVVQQLAINASELDSLRSLALPGRPQERTPDAHQPAGAGDDQPDQAGSDRHDTIENSISSHQ